MAAIAAGIFNQAAAKAQAFDPAKPQTASAEATSQSASSPASSSASVSANDFLTLLVTEMQNQDPTANTDPNEYINQLVNVNSLEQLIDINQTLSAGLGNSSPNTSSSVTSQATMVASMAPDSVTSNASGLSKSAATTAAGNLSIPGVLPAAQTLAQALSRQSRL